uniref:Uncharacterized protein n=1 Tax=Arundo donax TaxID=35708 RepID=A0A0A9F8S0_ARUDO
MIFQMLTQLLGKGEGQKVYSMGMHILVILECWMYQLKVF